MNIEPIIIRANRAETQYWRDLWRYRELFYFLSWRDILVRYKQTAIGIVWALIRPLATLLIFTMLNKMSNFSSGDVPRPLMIMVGLLPWQFFSNSLSDAGNSLVSNANLISKIYFPRLIVPISSIVTGLIDFVISAFLLLLLLMFYQFVPSWRIILVPLFLLLACGAALGAGLWVSALTVKYRDFRVIIPFVVQFGAFISPLYYLSTEVSDKWRLLYSINPMVGVIDGFRWCILGGDFQIYMPGFILSIVLVVVMLITGVWYFRRTEKTFADII